METLKGSSTHVSLRLYKDSGPELRGGTTCWLQLKWKILGEIEGGGTTATTFEGGELQRGVTTDMTPVGTAGA